MNQRHFSGLIGVLLWACLGLSLGVCRVPAASVSISIEPRWGHAGVRVGDRQDSAIDGTSRTVERLDGLFSGFQLLADDGHWIPASGQVGWMSLGQNRMEVTLTNLPSRNYRALRFDLGLPPEINHADPATFAPQDPLNPSLNGLHWSWQGGYVFLALEGHWRTSGGQEGGYSYHLANDPSRRTFELPVRFDLTNGSRLALGLQLDQVFDGRQPIGPMSENASTHSRTNDLLRLRLLANLDAAWTLDVRPDESKDPKPVGMSATVLIASNAPLHRFQMPHSFPQPALPRDNPLTEPGVALGRALFSETRLSGDDSQSCASCHRSEAAFSDAPRRVSRGIDGAEGRRNAMGLYNLAWQTRFFWDGRAQSLREQVLAPIQNPAEMHSSLESVTNKLMAAGYAPAFEAAFGPGGINSDRVARALEQYLLTLISGRSRFDRVQAGLERPTVEESRGFQLFFTEYDPRHEQYGADCFHCHGGALFSDFGFHNNGLDDLPLARDEGRRAVTGGVTDKAKFKTPLSSQRGGDRSLHARWPVCNARGGGGPLRQRGPAIGYPGPESCQTSLRRCPPVQGGSEGPCGIPEDVD